MTSPIIPSERRSGGILHLPGTLEEYPDCQLAIYHRMSSYGQAGTAKAKLEDSTYALVSAIRQMAPGRLRHISRGVEEGKLSEPRPTLIEVAKRAATHGWILVAANLSRFIRSESYDRRTNNEAWPSEEEFTWLREYTGPCLLTTLAHPEITESERHSLATKRLGTCGRPSDMTPELAVRIFDALGTRSSIDGNWERSIRSVAEEVAKWTGKDEGAAKSLIQRLVDAEVPESVAYRPGWRWKDCSYPLRAYKDALKRGLLTKGMGVSKP